MKNFDILLDIALILITSKVLGIAAKKIGLPQVVGFIVAGIFLGPSIWGPLFNFEIVGRSDVLDVLSEIGVIMIMFSAGLETDFKEMKKSGPKALLIALMGVVAPLALGFGAAIPFLGKDNLFGCIFMGTILTATSVGITVATLKELGVLSSKTGTTIVSSAIIDDIIGMVVLSIVIGFRDAAENPLVVIAKIVLFFICALLLGKVLRLVMDKLTERYPHTRRLPILSLAICFFYAWAAERIFGVADITGAYIAGLVLSFNKSTANYVDSKVEINSYMFFGPLFFANLGIKITFQNFTPHIALFALFFILAGIVGKFVGAGGMAMLCRYKMKESIKVGIGMLARGEVALIVTQKGIAAGLIDGHYLAIVVMLILVTSLFAPIMLKLLYKSDTYLNLPYLESGENAFDNLKAIEKSD